MSQISQPHYAYLVGTASAETYQKLFNAQLIYCADPDYRPDYEFWQDIVPAQVPEQFKNTLQSIQLDYGL